MNEILTSTLFLIFKKVLLVIVLLSFVFSDDSWKVYDESDLAYIHITVDPEDLEVGEKLRKGGFGLDEIERIKSLISDDSRVLIVGSHIGSLVIPVSRHCKEVVAIEANPKTYELLSLNLRLNDIKNFFHI